MDNEQIKKFCVKAVERDVTINDVLYSIMLLAQKQSERQDENG